MELEDAHAVTRYITHISVMLVRVFGVLGGDLIGNRALLLAAFEGKARRPWAAALGRSKHLCRHLPTSLTRFASGQGGGPPVLLTGARRRLPASHDEYM